MLIHSYDYKEIEVVKSVKENLKSNLETYYHLNQYISAKAKILHLANDYGQLDVLLTLQEPQRKIDSYISDEEKKREVAKTNYIAKKRKISYPAQLESSAEEYDVVLISDENLDIFPEITKASSVILIGSSRLKNTVTNLGFECVLEENNILILKKN
jgi:hypothetical protein